MKRSLFIAVTFILATLSMGAQDFADLGIKPSGSYSGGSIDNIDLFTGNASGSIPLVSYPQLGSLPRLTFSINFNTAPFNQFIVCDPVYYDSCYLTYVTNSLINGTEYSGGPTLDANIPIVSDISTAYAYVDDGPIYTTLTDTTGYTRHFLQEGVLGPSQYYYATDGSGYTFNGDAGIDPVPYGVPWNVPSKLYGPNGTLATLTYLTVAGADTSETINETQEQIQDLNGNAITRLIANPQNVFQGPPSNASTLGWTDSVGRFIPIPFPTYPWTAVNDSAVCPNLGVSNQPALSSYVWSVPGPNSTSMSFLICSNDYYEIQSVTLADGTYWGFIYDVGDYTDGQTHWGNIKEVRYPTGAKVQYQFEQVPRWPDWGDPSYYYAVSSRSEYDAAGSVRVTSFKYDTLSPTSFTTTVTDGMGNDTVHQFTDLAATKQAYETGTIYYQGPVSGGKLLETSSISYNYANDADYAQYFDPTVCYQRNEGVCDSYGSITKIVVPKITNVKKSSVTVTSASGLSSSIVNRYNWSLDPVGLIYSTQPDTVIQNNVITVNKPLFAEAPYAPPSPGTPNGKNLIGPIRETEIANFTTNSNTTNVIAATVYGYDENNGSPQGMFGNQTSISGWLNTTNQNALLIDPIPCCLILKSSTIFNSQGMPALTVDGNGTPTIVNTTQCGGLYPSSVTVSGDFIAPETITNLIDCATGQLLSSTDANSITTKYKYLDPLGRVTAVQRAYSTPAESDINIGYSGNQVTMSGAVTASQTSNGLGQVVQQIGSNGAVITTQYNANGQMASQTNPHLPNNANYGSTFYQYDALGRPTIQSQPAKTIQWCYENTMTNGQTNCRANVTGSLGAWVDESDQANEDVQQLFNGYGQLTAVVEPGPSGNLLTSYSYDGLSNLQQVTQSGKSQDTPRVRRFVYDSMSRLLESFQPESGWTCYGTTSPSATGHGYAPANGSNCAVGTGYDANNNLLYKVDARGKVISYVYDPLNRLVLKTKPSSDPNAMKTTTTYQYDGAINGVGRLWSESTQTTDNYQDLLRNDQSSTSNLIFSYDAAGRVTESQQCVVNICTPHTSGIPTYSYDPLGNLTGYSAGVNNLPGVGTINIQRIFDTAHQLLSVTSSWNDSIHPSSLFSNATYTASGQLSGGSYGVGLPGSGTGFSQTRTFDPSTMRLTSETDWGSIVQRQSTPGSASIVITGSELHK